MRDFMNKKTRPNSKLNLHRETLHRLDADKLARAAGGLAAWSLWCFTSLVKACKTDACACTKDRPATCA